MKCSSLALAAALLVASPALAAPIDPAPVVAAERAFAADGLELAEFELEVEILIKNRLRNPKI